MVLCVAVVSFLLVLACCAHRHVAYGEHGLTGQHSFGKAFTTRLKLAKPHGWFASNQIARLKDLIDEKQPFAAKAWLKNRFGSAKFGYHVHFVYAESKALAQPSFNRFENNRNMPIGRS
jgi:hypothetical protein